MRRRYALWRLGTILDIVAIVSCSSVDPAPGGGHVEYAGGRSRRRPPLRKARTPRPPWDRFPLSTGQSATMVHADRGGELTMLAGAEQPAYAEGG